MEQWHVLELGDQLSAQVTLDRLRDAIAGGTDPSAAAFMRRSAGDLHCAVTVYLSPGAGRIAALEGAARCPPPGRRGLQLIAGPESSWSLLAG